MQRFRSLPRIVHALLRETQGVALIEFVLIFPILFMLVFGGIELSRYMLIVQKLNKSAYALGDMVAQLNPVPTNPANATPTDISTQRLQAIFQQFPRLMAPYANPDGSDRAVMVSSVVNCNGTLRVLWQTSGFGPEGGTLTDNISSVNAYVNGGTFTPANPPAEAGFSGRTRALLTNMLPMENMIVVEVRFTYRPIVQSLEGMTGFTIAERVLERRLFFHPRYGSLYNLPTVSRVTPGFDRCGVAITPPPAIP